uniref:Uncharacterized protein n=1 Tax=Romanomermis culicivorax TaxID=13658 RepID=A0A915IAP7_ROMCU
MYKRRWRLICDYVRFWAKLKVLKRNDQNFTFNVLRIGLTAFHVTPRRISIKATKPSSLVASLKRGKNRKRLLPWYGMQIKQNLSQFVERRLLRIITKWKSDQWAPTTIATAVMQMWKQPAANFEQRATYS